MSIMKELALIADILASKNVGSSTLKDEILRRLTKSSSTTSSQVQSAHNLSTLSIAEDARNKSINSTIQYNSLIKEKENSVCHDIGYTPKALLGLPPDATAVADTCASFSQDESDSSEMSEISDNQNNHIRPSENTLRAQAYQRSFSDIFDKFCCTTSCSLGRKCGEKLNARNMYEEMKSFWGDQTKPLTTKVRRSSVIQKLLTAYHRNPKQSTVEFLFTVGDNEGLRVCERAYLQVIGHTKSGLWTRSKEKIIEQMKTGNYSDISCLSVDDIKKAMKQGKYKTEIKSRAKQEHCESFIHWYGKQNGSLSPHVGETNLTILPFETIAQLYVEYKYQCEIDNHEPASDETFRKVYNKLRDMGLYKFTRGKGTFPTCDICNNANDLLATGQSIKMSSQVRDLIVKMKQLHLKQQAGERLALAAKIREATNSYDTEGNPTHAVFFGDGMTVYAARTPKYGVRAGKRDAAFFENRVFGVEVYCGQINGEILIHTDDLVRGGSNFIVEVQRRLIAELGLMLSRKGLLLPKNLHFQWDNCGENKNKTAFMFNSLLVELGYFETVTVGFLIVGHTHASIDQYFSCLRGLIKSSVFIASPIALQHLFALPPKTNDSKYRPPILQIRIHFLHDYVSFFDPYWNKKIHNYGIPYQFKFTSIFGKAVCQYKQFSDHNLKWLPVFPMNITRGTTFGDLSHHGTVYTFEDNFTLASTAGSDDFMEHLGIKDPTKNLLHEVVSSSKDNFVDKASTLRQAFPILKDQISTKAMHEQELRREDEANGITDVRRYNADTESTHHLTVQKNLQKVTTKESGFLILLDYTATFPTPPLISTLKPTPINLKDIWNSHKAENKNHVAELEAAEMRAQLLANDLADLELQDDNNNNVANSKVHADEPDQGEQLIEMQETLKGMKLPAEEQRKAKIAAKKKNQLKSDVQFIISGVANMKAAAKYMLEHKLQKGLVNLVEQNFQQLGPLAFRKKIVTHEDVEYYKIRLDIDSILNELDNEIKKAPVFEWVPKTVLSERQLEENKERMAQKEQEYMKYSKLYMEILSRPKENAKGEEVIGGKITMVDIKAREKKEQLKANKETITKPKLSRAKKTKPNTQDALIAALQTQVAVLVAERDKKRQVSKISRQKSHNEETESDNGDSSFHPSSCQKRRKELTESDNDDSSICLSTTKLPHAQQTSISRSSSPQLFVSNHSREESSSSPGGYFKDSPTEDIITNNVEMSSDSTYDNALAGVAAGVVDLANKLITALKKQAQDWKPSSICRRRSESELLESFIVLLKNRVIGELDFVDYKSLYLPMLEMFGVNLPHVYTEDLLKKAAQRQQYLSEIVDALTVSKLKSNSSKIDITTLNVVEYIRNNLKLL